MARTARHAFDLEILSTRADRDTIVPSCHKGVEDDNIFRKLNVDAICVGTVTVGNDPYSSHLHILTVVYHDVEHLAVQ